jgi:hypothetical protein
MRRLRGNPDRVPHGEIEPTELNEHNIQTTHNAGELEQAEVGRIGGARFNASDRVLGDDT